MKQTLQAKPQGQGGEGAKTKDGELRPGRDLHEAGPSRPQNRSNCFPRHRNGWAVFFALQRCPLSPERQSVRNSSAKRSRQTVPVMSDSASDLDAGQPMLSSAL